VSFRLGAHVDQQPTAMLQTSQKPNPKYHRTNGKTRTAQSGIWFYPIHKPTFRKIKKGIFCQGTDIDSTLKLILPAEKRIENQGWNLKN
jgi:hypothetical protein